MGTILVTGGTGFIGSHTCVELGKAGLDYVILDNLCNSKIEVLDRIALITGKRPAFYNADILDRRALANLFENEKVDSVIHFAGLKAVGESVKEPWKYYRNNVSGTLTLLDVMQEFSCKTIVFSSSATVYGDPELVPITEECPLGEPTSPYGKTKKVIEEILQDLCVADPSLNVAILRYFNPIGAHESGLIGEDPCGIPNNLMPYITQVATGKIEKLGVFGNDYDTPDGTGVRDYIHVCDLALGHLATLRAIEGARGTHIWNLGTGTGCSVLEVIETFKRVNSVDIPFEFLPRREGDVSCLYSSVEKAEQELGWQAKRTLEDMCRDSWNWQHKNPEGYLS